MATPTRQGTIAKTATGAANVSSMAITLPGSIAAGEGVIVAVSFDSNGVLTVGAGSSAGWVKVGQRTDSAASTSLAVFWLPSAIGGGSDSLTVATTVADRGTALAQRISGHDTGTTPEVAFADGTAAANACNPPSLTPAGGALDYLYLAVAGIDQAAGAAPSAGPAAPFGNFDSQVGPTQGSHIGWSWYSATADSSEDPGTFTHVSAVWVGATVAIYPAGGGGGTPQNINLGVVTEREAGRATSVSRDVALSRVVERESEFALAISRDVVLARVIERELGLAPSASRDVALGRVTERESVLAASVALAVALGRVVERELALAVSAFQGQTVNLGVVVEREGVRAPSLRRDVALALVIERELARAVDVSQLYLLSDIACETVVFGAVACAGALYPGAGTFPGETTFPGAGEAFTEVVDDTMIFEAV